jgi:hypothetical protein
MTTFVKYAICFLAGVAVGSIGTYIFESKKCMKYAENEINTMRAYYDKERYKPISGQIQEQPSENDTKTVKTDTEEKIDTMMEQLSDRLDYNENEIRAKYSTAFDERTDEEVMEDELERYYAENEHPKDDDNEEYITIIPEEEYAYGELPYSYETLRYHKKTKTFVDANTGQMIDDPVRSLGAQNVDYIDRTRYSTIYIKNDKLKIVYEIEILEPSEDNLYD